MSKFERRWEQSKSDEYRQANCMLRCAVAWSLSSVLPLSDTHQLASVAHKYGTEIISTAFWFLPPHAISLV